MDAARFAEVHVSAMDYTRGYVYIMEQDKLRRIDTSKEKNSDYVDYLILLSLSKNCVASVKTRKNILFQKYLFALMTYQFSLWTSTLYFTGLDRHFDLPYTLQKF